MITDRPQIDSTIEQYMKLVPDGDLTQLYKEQIENFSTLISNLSEREAEFRYAARQNANAFI